jgi:hypothetical protein
MTYVTTVRSAPFQVNIDFGRCLTGARPSRGGCRRMFGISCSLASSNFLCCPCRRSMPRRSVFVDIVRLLYQVSDAVWSRERWPPPLVTAFQRISGHPLQRDARCPFWLLWRAGPDNVQRCCLYSGHQHSNCWYPSSSRRHSTFNMPTKGP